MKTCTGCKIEKELSEFCRDKRRKDGKCPKCKACECLRQASYFKNNSEIILSRNRDFKKNNPTTVRRNRRTYNEKHRLEKAIHNTELYTKNKKEQCERRKLRNEQCPEKEKARAAARRLTVKGFENHHWSYKKEHSIDITHLTASEHRVLHGAITYDQEHFCFRSKETNELLNTKEKHLTHWMQVKEKWDQLIINK